MMYIAQQKHTSMAHPKFDYDSDQFYEEIYALAMQGLSDAEIADALSERFGQTLHPDVFGSMKNGTYANWTKEQKERRSERMNRVLARGRRKINSIVRGAYLKAALGGRKTRNKNTTIRAIFNEKGEKIGEAEVQRIESEIEMPPNVQALSTWLYHHDPEWRKVQRGLDMAEDDVPTDVDNGVDIEAWIRKETEIANDNNDNL